MSGELLYKDKLNVKRNQLKIDMSDFETGIYILKVYNKTNVFTKQIIKI